MPKARFAAMALAIGLAGCGDPPPITGLRLVPWHAKVETSPSSGITTCTASARHAYIFQVGDAPPILTAIAAYGLYPDSYVYVTIDGERFAGREEIVIDQRLKERLLSGSVIFYSYAPLPSGVRAEESASLSGIGRALPCLTNVAAAKPAVLR